MDLLKLFKPYMFWRLKDYFACSDRWTCEVLVGGQNTGMPSLFFGGGGGGGTWVGAIGLLGIGMGAR